MLGDKDVMATVAVKSLKMARPFYEDILGLKPANDGEAQQGVLGLKAGQATVLIYESAFAGSNKATVLTWALGDRFDDEVKALQARGVAFEAYDLPGMVKDGPIHRMGDMKVAWFKDPDGNILSVGNY